MDYPHLKETAAGTAQPVRRRAYRLIGLLLLRDRLRRTRPGARKQRVIAVSGDNGHRSNRGRLCSKGMQLADTVRGDAARVLRAQWRAARGEARTDIALDRALDIAADRPGGYHRPPPSRRGGLSTCPGSC